MSSKLFFAPPISEAQKLLSSYDVKDYQKNYFSLNLGSALLFSTETKNFNPDRNIELSDYLGYLSNALGAGFPDSNR